MKTSKLKFCLLYALIVIGAVGAMMGCDALGWPGWSRLIPLAVAAGLAWLVGRGETALDKTAAEADAFGRDTRLVKLHDRKAQAMRRQSLNWRAFDTGKAPPVCAATMREALGLFPDWMVEADDLVWIAAERDWWGWPDPPRYVVLAFDASGAIQAATDIQEWPENWHAPSLV